MAMSLLSLVQDYNIYNIFRGIRLQFIHCVELTYNVLAYFIEPVHSAELNTKCRLFLLKQLVAFFFYSSGLYYFFFT